jgi:hypothetical protein
MAALIGLIAGLTVFGLWMHIVGNPHVIETVLGLVIAAAVWITIWLQLRRFFRRLAGRSGVGG